VLVREEYYKGHYRILQVVNGERVFYSIDTYQKIPLPEAGHEPYCDKMLELDRYKLCYKKIDSYCEALILVTPSGAEVVNYRLIVEGGGDPAEGDPAKALSYCEEKARNYFSRATG